MFPVYMYLAVMTKSIVVSLALFIYVVMFIKIYRFSITENVMLTA